MVDVGIFQLLQADLGVQNELIHAYGVKEKVSPDQFKIVVGIVLVSHS
jgi:hypothetical protein